MNQAMLPPNLLIPTWQPSQTFFQCCHQVSPHLYPIVMRRRTMEMKELEIPMTTDRHWELKQRTHITPELAEPIIHHSFGAKINRLNNQSD